MDPLLAAVAALSSAALLLAYRPVFRGTFLEVSLARRRFSGFPFLIHLACFVLPALVVLPLITSTGTSAVSNDVTSGHITRAIVIATYSLAMFFAAFRFFSRILYKRDRESRFPEGHKRTYEPIVIGRAILVCNLLVFAFATEVLGGRHAYLAGFVSGDQPGVVRHINNATPGISYIALFFLISSIGLSAVLALPEFRRRRVERIALLVSVVFFATFYGSKGPVIAALLAFVMSGLEMREKSTNMLVVRIGIRAAAGLGLLFVTLQLTTGNLFDLGEFARYFVDRVFVGQMAGLFEQSRLGLGDANYIFHAVPGLDAPVYHRDLMIISEGLPPDALIGYKVTLFPAEAEAIAGLAGVLIAPVVMAGQFHLAYKIIEAAARFAAADSVVSGHLARYVAGALLTLTGGVTEHLAFKFSMVLALVLLSVGLTARCLAPLHGRTQSPVGKADRASV